MKKMKKTLALVLSLSLAAGILGGCTSNTEPTATTAAATTAAATTAAAAGATEAATEPAVEEKIDIEFLGILHTDSPAADNIVAAIGEATNSNLKYQWIPAASQEEKLTTALVSGNLGDVVWLGDLQLSTVRAALKSDLFWEVESYLPEYENLATIQQGRIDSSKVGGKLYGVPNRKPVARYGVVIRQDWLDNLGLEVPHTLEDLYTVAQAFTENDPDGNGAKDTTGFVERRHSFGMGLRMVAGWYGGPNFWEVENGTAKFWAQDESFYKAAEYFKNLYSNGYMNSDWVVMEKTEQQNFMAQSKAGIMITGLYDAANFQKMADDIGMGDTMKWTLINDMHAEGVERRIVSDTNNGVGGIMAIPKSYVKDEAELKRVLSFINAYNSMEVHLLLTYGIQGVHWDYDAQGVPVYLDETLWKQEVQALSGSRPNELWNNEIVNPNALRNLSNELILDNEPYAVYNECQAFSSPTYDSMYTSLLLGLEEAYAKYCTGETDVDALKAGVDNWLASGGQAMIDEYTAEANS